MKFDYLPITSVATIISGGTPKTSMSEYWNGNIPWLSVKDFNNGSKFVYSTEKHITELGLKNSSTNLLRANDIIISARGTVGEMAMIPFDMAFNQSCFGIRANIEKILPDYLYYALKNNIQTIKSSTHGSVFDTITLKDFEVIKIPVPDLETQKKIVRILSGLDQKIELNNQQNKTIEKQALALVQKYINNEKGTVKLKEIMSFDNGFAFKSKDYVDSGKYKVITIKNVQDGLIDSSSAQFVTDYPKDMRDYHKLSIGDVLLSLTGNVGRVGIVFEKNLLLNQRVAKVKPEDENLLPFLYFLFRKKDFKQKLEALAKGTAQLNLSPIETLNEKIAYSEQSALKLSNRLKPFFEKIILNNQNNKTLSSIRDSLLPKLMSDKINLNEVIINE